MAATPAAVRRLMAGLAQSRAFTVAPEPLARIRAEFASAAVGEEEVAAEIGETFGGRRATSSIRIPRSA